ncbi:MAG: toprim domain-containing protein [Steroidobacteraceae bacterium]
MLRAADLHAQLGSSWPAILAQLGIPEEVLRPKKPGPCPACGGRDRFVFDNRKLRGDFFCRGCGAGDGFALLMRVYGWGFAEARRRVMQAAGLDGRDEPTPHQAAPIAPGAAQVAAPAVATPPARVRTLTRSTCAVADCADAVDYLASRGLWPLPPDCGLRAHVSVDYFDRGQRVGKFAALVAEVRDRAGALVTAHVTYLEAGHKLAEHEPRKLLSPLTGREGCAVRLMPPGELLGIAEGIETALSAAALDGVPVWAALNTALLGKFEPPEGVRVLRIYADRDEPGLLAAGQLMERLQGRLRLELRTPPAPSKDFNNLLMSRSRGEVHTHA